ncbi:MAG TPA: ankyrin repeat domain-containing protein [Magnetospirillum sp.]|nr:ankyrin repeat domain-containing protein [Magnetospirillum sp.]
MRIGVLFLTLATVVFLGWLGMFGGGMASRTTVELDARPDAYRDARRTFARIQSDLERTAAGHEPWPLPAGISSDPLESIVDAYRLFRDGNVKAMDMQLKALALKVGDRLKTPPAEMPANAWPGTLAYFGKLAAIAAEAPEPAARLLATMRQVDGVLSIEADPLFGGQYESHRVGEGYVEPHAAAWLRLPCRTIIGRVEALRAAQARLDELAGPLLSCPSDITDLAVLEAQAKAPAMLPTRTQVLPPRLAMSLAIEPSVPALPWDHEMAAAWMDEDPDAAEPVLAADTSPSGLLDYALFLHAFRPAGPDNQARIHALVRAVEALAQPKAHAWLADYVDQALPQDGGDAALVRTLRLAALTNVAGEYVIPCPVLRARPALLNAVRPLFGAGGDSALPRSGCSEGRGVVRGFPEAEVAAYVEASVEADGHYLATHRGAAFLSMKTDRERLKLDPRGLAAEEPPALDHPYQVWGMASLANRAVEMRIAALYRNAHERLSAWYVRQGLAADEAAQAAKTGLFQAVMGAQCGGDVPAPSLRGLLLDKAPLADIRDALAGKEPPEVTACAYHAGMDPLPHVAVGHPQALLMMLDRGARVDERNSFGKTPLMVAAQQNLPEAARLLLDHGAAVNATTWMRDDDASLRHDGRSPLMYAAASGSLAVIKLLLERGADPHMADTNGRRAVDYLLGFGPVPANFLLSADERAEAARLLY